MDPTYAPPKPDPALGAGGKALWVAVVDLHELDPAQLVTLLEACRAKDRLDKLDGILVGKGATWATLAEDARSEGTVVEVRVDGALASANTTANMLKQLLASLRLPDGVTGKRPQQRGGARGAYRPSGAAPAGVSSIERARSRQTG